MKITKEYIAGFLDGEGYVGLEKKKDNRIKRGYSIRFRIELSNKNKTLLEEIRKRYGGRLWLKSNKEDCWQLTFGNRKDCIKLLEDILPYLLIKKAKSKKLLEYLKRTNSLIGRGKMLTDKQIKYFSNGITKNNN